jgi:eukaryotic-like serine/threonine-protein kinase
VKPLSDAALAHLQRLADTPDLAGTRYTVVEEVGRGGMGAVYRARDTVLGRDVALKVIRTPDLPPPLAARLVQEARILARLEHPGIVPVHDLGALSDGRTYYVMKLVRGRRLDAWLADGRSLRERLNLLLRVAEAVAFAHAHGVIHRDLKPANLMVGEFGEVMVLDWGVAKLIEKGEKGEKGEKDEKGDEGNGGSSFLVHTDHGTVLGTRGYMAPEQESGQVQLVDERADVFALGALLGTLAGEEAPRRLRAIAERATSRAREQRYATVPALAKEIARFLDGEPVDAYRETVLERAGRLAVKYRTPLLLVLAYLLMRMVFIIVSGR